METLKAFGVTPLFLDVSDEASIDACLTLTGPLDVLVNCAGYGSFGAIGNVPMEEARRQLEVNLFGLAALCRKVLPGMRTQGYGRIVNISSVAGKACLYFGGWYHVSKYAVEAFSDALRAVGLKTQRSTVSYRRTVCIWRAALRSRWRISRERGPWIFLLTG